MDSIWTEFVITHVLYFDIAPLTAVATQLHYQCENSESRKGIEDVGCKQRPGKNGDRKRTKRELVWSKVSHIGDVLTLAFGDKRCSILDGTGETKCAFKPFILHYICR